MADLNHLVQDLIHTQNTLTLATVNNNIAWSAPVYYAPVDACFYFFSNPESRHIRESLSSGQASSSIFAATSSWQGIRGIQMSGKINEVLSVKESITAFHIYLKKYPFLKDFFPSGQSLNLNFFLKKNRVKLYAFKPDLVYYLDNQIEFGFKKQVFL